tara:strand:- start:53 stop:622 length:570 start_codon:yes stop_codon:yes gene_type:complete
MNNTILDLFSCPVYKSEVNDYDNIQEEIARSLDKLPFKPNPYFGQPNKLTGFDINILDEYSFTSFKKELINHLKIYCQDRIPNNSDYFIRSSWIAQFETGDYGGIHDHGYSDISGVYYYKKNDDDGNIFFQSPLLQAESSYCFISPYYQLPTEQGELLLFPGWLKHGIHQNNTDDDRISLSFDIVFTRQ